MFDLRNPYLKGVFRTLEAWNPHRARVVTALYPPHDQTQAVISAACLCVVVASWCAESSNIFEENNTITNNEKEKTKMQ